VCARSEFGRVHVRVCWDWSCSGKRVLRSVPFVCTRSVISYVITCTRVLRLVAFECWYAEISRVRVRACFDRLRSCSLALTSVSFLCTRTVSGWCRTRDSFKHVKCLIWCSVLLLRIKRAYCWIIRRRVIDLCFIKFSTRAWVSAWVSECVSECVNK